MYNGSILLPHILYVKTCEVIFSEVILNDFYVIYWAHLVGNKAIEQISTRRKKENKARQIF